MIALLSLAFTLFAGELEIWTSSEAVRNALTSVKTNFEKEYSAKVNILVLNKDLTNQFKTAALSGKGPDILVWAHDVIGELAESGLIEPTTIPPNLKKELHPIALKAFTYKGKLYGYPYALESVALICNQKLVQVMPQSLNDLKKMALTHKNRDGESFGFLYDIQSFFFSFPILAAGDGHIFADKNGTLDTSDIGLHGSGFIRGLSFLKSLVDEKIIPISIDRGIAMTKMKAGLLACTIDGPWAINELISAGLTLKISPIPPLDGNQAKPFVGAQGLFVRRGTKNSLLAFEFIEKSVLTLEGIEAIYRFDPRIPVRSDVIAKLKNEFPYLAPFEESASHGIPMPNIPQMGAVWSAMGPAINLSLSGRDDINAALLKAHNQVKHSLTK